MLIQRVVKDRNERVVNKILQISLGFFLFRHNSSIYKKILQQKAT